MIAYEDPEKMVAQPVAAFVLFRTGEHQGYTEKTIEKYLITGDLLHSPAYVSKEDMEELAEIVERTTDVASFRGLVNERILYVGGAKMAFFSPGGPRLMYIHKVKSTETRMVMIPNGVFVYEGPYHKLSFYWCLGSMEQLRANEPCLLPAPMPNVNGGDVCLGDTMQNIKFTEDPVDMAEKVEQCFYAGSFNNWTQIPGSPLNALEVKVSEPYNAEKFLSHELIKKWQKGRKMLTLQKIVGIAHQEDY